MEINQRNNNTAIRKRGVINYFKTLPNELKDYFQKLENLLQDYPADISLSHIFALIEKAMHMALYCGIIKMHSADKDLTDKAIQSYYVTRDDYKSKFELLFGEKISPGALTKLEDAEKIRDKIMHGKKTTDSDKFKAIKNALEFSQEFNEQIFRKASFKPFGKLQGFKGAKKPLGKSTSRLILKGLGFNLN